MLGRRAVTDTVTSSTTFIAAQQHGIGLHSDVGLENDRVAGQAPAVADILGVQIDDVRAGPAVNLQRAGHAGAVTASL